jgi:hypothetical protein
MGYTTSFWGEFTIDKPVDEDTYKLLDGLNKTRRMKRTVTILAKRLKITPTECKKLYGTDCEFWVDDAKDYGQTQTEDIKDYNTPPKTQPGLWNHWAIDEDRQTILWDEGEKFYEYIEWIRYLIDVILLPRGYVVNGTVSWSGEENEDMGEIEVKDNKVFVKRAVIFMLTEEDAERVRQLVNSYTTNPLKECIDEVLDEKDA